VWGRVGESYSPRHKMTIDKKTTNSQCSECRGKHFYCVATDVASIVTLWQMTWRALSLCGE